MMAPSPDTARNHVTAMELVRASRLSRIVAWLIALGVALAIAVLYLTPWQQTVLGSGRVIAYAPNERQQNLEAPIEGRVLRWHVHEGATVVEGQPIVELTDNDADVMQRLRTEQDAIAARADAARARSLALQSRIDALQSSRSSGLAAAEARVMMATQRVSVAEQGLAAAEAALATAQLNSQRQRTLTEKGLVSQRQLELTELEATRAVTEVERARAALIAAKNESQALVSDKLKVNNDATAAINDALASKQVAEADVANASAELARMASRLARQSAQVVTAPRDGVVFRIVANGHTGEIVKAGDLLAVLVPNTNDRAVEVWVSGNDMPLVYKGARARIQFEGWPALQFSGWPSIAVGTFGAEVLLVDATDNGAGKFRVVLGPGVEGNWPEPSYLRQGGRAHGWILLGQVRLGYELWRQFNAFPPSLPSEPDSVGKPGQKEAAK